MGSAMLASSLTRHREGPRSRGDRTTRGRPPVKSIHVTVCSPCSRDVLKALGIAALSLSVTDICTSIPDHHGYR
jgi:hypothetical protein